MKWFSKQQADYSILTAQGIAVRLPDILLEAQKIASTIQTGTHGRRKSGMGDHFWQYRHYSPETDAAHRIDWRQSARSDHIYVREQEDERAQTAHIWLDPTASMHYASDDNLRTKYEYALTLALTLSYQFTSADEIVTSETAGHIPTAINHLKHVDRLADTLIDNAPDLKFRLKPNSTVFLFSDFLHQSIDDLTTFKASTDALNIKAFVIVPIDPTEASFNFDGHIKFEDMAATDSFETQNATHLKARYQQKFSAHIKTIQKIFGEHHVMTPITNTPLIETASRMTQHLIL